MVFVEVPAYRFVTEMTVVYRAGLPLDTWPSTRAFVMYRIYSIVSRDSKFFSSFRATYNQGRLTLFTPLPYRKVQMTISLILATFCRPSSLCAFCSLLHHVHTPSQKGLWWTEGSCSGVSHRWRNRGGAHGPRPPHFYFCLNIVSLSNIISIGSSD